ncbi:5-bromo-4-chloroindolyl phosphate hydrolysis family protein [Parasedimentitalea psychrophila]|uniref:5-bromo-4-chloroindolyl phosphate hydrolysis family protein n=1 Tax=Parasedimentitalea psychrophila TaxID=2997337 RepID=A0A9Y2KWH2_9RHOB|nr:5-bromo-4-chloroindolyl phosphate hydrolysis family protein [Parasedimentitalea psychrophila]WIY23953.1 5-bromo-4-chloroindolyl phosphate hydrolysis family protein [Parasedimentitalea psychrophila]
MAKKFGGHYSPEGNSDRPEGAPPRSAAPSNSYRNAQPDPIGAGSNLMFVPPAVMVLFSLLDGAMGLALGLLAAGAWTAAAWMLRQGLRAQSAYNARRVARRPALPRKLAASILTGIGAALAAWKAEPGLLIAAVYGSAVLALHMAAFGLDPMVDKGVEGIDEFQQSRVARVVNDAEACLTTMRHAARRAQDRQIDTRVAQFQSIARELFRTVEEDPRDLTAARKYLTVYLQGARDATVKFADIYSRSQDAQARADYLALLDDLEQGFAARNRKMLLEDRSDLTIEIDVLRDRLQREGVHLDLT